MKKIAKSIVSSTSATVLLLAGCSLAIVVWSITLFQAGGTSLNTTLQNTCPSPKTYANNSDFYEFVPDKSGCVSVPELGISLHIPDVLIEQRLLARKITDTTQHPLQASSDAYYFTTDALLRFSAQCNGTDHWIGAMSRYEGSVTDMPEHTHGSTALDFSGFHIAYTTPVGSCIDTETTDATQAANARGTEATAAQNLWESMRYAQPR